MLVIWTDRLGFNRYDADEPSTQAPPPAAEPPKQPVPAQSATPQSTGFVAQNVENPQYENDGMHNMPQAYQQHDYSQGYGMGQQQQQQQGFQGAGNVMPTAPEPEPQGTGIKEDG